MSLVVMATGGTGGHIYPAVATAKELISRGHEVLMLGQSGGMEQRVSAEQNLPFFGVSAGKLARSGQGRADPRELLRAAQGVTQARTALQRLKPAAVVGYGGFASLPGVLAAQSLGIPTVLHEQNALLGLTQKIAVGRAKAVGTAYAQVKGLAAGKATLVGMPVREEKMQRDAALAKLGLQGGPLTILVMGGSQGSLFLNDNVPEILSRLFGPDGKLATSNRSASGPVAPAPLVDLDFTAPASGKAPVDLAPPGSAVDLAPLGSAVDLAPLGSAGVQVLHATGTRWLEQVQQQLGHAQLGHAQLGHAQPWYHPAGFVDAVAAWSAADLAITRAGTSTLAEAAFHGVPLLMVPLPESAENHQYHNALAVAQAGAGRVIGQQDAAETLGQAVLECAVPAALRAMHGAALARAQPGAAARFASLIELHLR